MSLTLKQVWEQVPPDPDLSIDLGYKLRELMVINCDENEEKYIILPSEEEHLSEDEFLVTTTQGICTLDNYR